MAFKLLDGVNDWRTATRIGGALLADGIADGPVLSLKADPKGPLALGAKDGSLGRLRLPRRLALDETHLPYLLVGGYDPHIRRFNRETSEFDRLPGIGGRGRQARELYAPSGIAIIGRSLYVADYKRVQIFDLETLALVETYPLESGIHIDLAVHAWQAYILTGRKVYRHRPGARHLETIHLEEEPKETQWRYILVSRKGEILLWNGQDLKRYDPRGNSLPSVDDAGAVREDFDPPALYTDYHQPARFLVPIELADPCEPRLPNVPITPEDETWARAIRQPDGRLFQYDDGRRMPIETDLSVIDESPRPALYARQGCWISKPLDSKEYGCQWHCVEIDLEALPAGSKIAVLTYSSPELFDSSAIQTDQWDIGCTLVGKMQPGELKQTFLIQSLIGQYLALRVDMSGDGGVSPHVRQLKIDFPRDSYLKYLPAEYARNEASRRWHEQFLAIIQAEWDALEARIADFAAYADPRAVPGGDLLNYLASWLALPLEGTWTDEQKRRLLMAAPAIITRRGTMAGLRAYLQVYLENMAGLPPEQQRMYPVIVEGYRERERSMLPSGETLGSGMPLWSASVVRRLQLDVYATESEVELISTGDPARDLFHEYAHSFRVYIPAVWVRSKSDEQMLRRALDTEKPAHTAYEMVLLPAAVIIGVQSTLDVDMILGSRPPTQLSQSTLNASTRLQRAGDENNRLSPGVRLT